MRTAPGHLQTNKAGGALRSTRRIRRTPGRPSGSTVRLLKDPQRFALAVAYVLGTFGLGPRIAAFLALTIVDSDEPITIESLRDVLTVVSSEYRGQVSLEHRAFGLAQKLQRTMDRLNRRDRDWLIYSTAALTSLVHFVASKNQKGIETALKMLEGAGWLDVLARVHWRISKALQSNFPEFEERLSAAALRLLSKQLMQHEYRQ